MKTGWWLAAWLMTAATFPATGEIVERELGTDASGNPVTGYVLQGNRDFQRRSRVSGLPVRRGIRARSDSTFESEFGYWWVPIVPMHCGGPVHGYSRGVTVWHGWGNQVSVTIVR